MAALASSKDLFNWMVALLDLHTHNSIESNKSFCHSHTQDHSHSKHLLLHHPHHDHPQPSTVAVADNMRIRRKTHRPVTAQSHNSPLARCMMLLVACSFFGAHRYYLNLQRERLDASNASLRGFSSDASKPLFNQDNAAQQARNLIVVAGHSVTTNTGHLQDANRDEQDWYLLPYQRHRGLPAAIVAHIQAGIQAAAQDPQSLLVFSGGQTRAVMGPESEGASYYRVAEVMNLWPDHGKQSYGADSLLRNASVRARTTTEEFATDSFTNLLYSICRFKEVTGQFPRKITVVSFTFKQKRFETLHAAALHWPSSRFEYIGVDPPIATGFDLEEATRGELEQAAKPFETDPYGCHSSILQQKRLERNPFARTPPYELSCPDMKDLLHYCGLKIISSDKVPWASAGNT